MRIRLNCLACGHPMDLGEAYEDYAGEVRCWGCRTVLEVTLQDGKLKAMRRGGTAVVPSEVSAPAAAVSAATR